MERYDEHAKIAAMNWQPAQIIPRETLWYQPPRPEQPQQAPSTPIPVPVAPTQAKTQEQTVEVVKKKPAVIETKKVTII